MSSELKIKMQAVRSFFKWSFYAVAFVGVLVVGGMAGFWLSIETLIFLMDVAA
jgi:hypothetical protein